MPLTAKPPEPKTNFPYPKPAEPVDERTVCGAFITNGLRLYEIGLRAEAGVHAVNVATGYPIVLTLLTVRSCWLVPREADYEELLG
jgi:hypothetical protein